VATILMIFLKISCPNFSRLLWRSRHAKFQIGMAAAIPAIPLPAPLLLSSCIILHSSTPGSKLNCSENPSHQTAGTAPTVLNSQTPYVCQISKLIGFTLR